MLMHLLHSNVVLTLGNGGKAGSIYMLLVAICGMFLTCLCESSILSTRLRSMANSFEAMAEMASIAPTA